MSISFTAHSYGLYNSQLWVIQPTVVGCKTCAQKLENSCCQIGKLMQGKCEKEACPLQKNMNIRIAPNDKHNRHNRHRQRSIGRCFMRLIKKFTIACPPLRSGHKACIIHTGYQAGHTEVTLSPDAKASGLLLCASLNLSIDMRLPRRTM